MIAQTSPSTIAPTSAPTSAPSPPSSAIVTLSATRSLVSTTRPPPPTSSRAPTRRPRPANVDCRRQQLQRECRAENGERKSTQFVIRWHVANGFCQSYVHGYCQGTSVSNDRTLRTKDDCEALCLTSAEFRDSDLFSFLTQNRVPVRQQAVAVQPAAEVNEEGELMDNAAPFDAQLVAFQSEDPQDFQFTAAEEVTPPPRKKCTRSPYRFTIRWFRHNGECIAMPHGFCHGEQVHVDETLKSKLECERHCPGVAESRELIEVERLIRRA
ncbi:hypothetical protein M3Y99_01803500 [Aphelenchoides fujianensis]|nr:hypothetical protein M3Y99_01803500 [Aphelenchoides fujianensis]